MPPIKDVTLEIDEPNSARMNFRTKERVKRTIQRAAALSGLDDSAFTINAAYQSAIATIAAHEATLLQTSDYQAFFDALDNSPAPTDRLREAFKRHGATVVSK
ncbi:type II toxin-antitoxin system TacA family antitoxin